MFKLSRKNLHIAIALSVVFEYGLYMNFDKIGIFVLFLIDKNGLRGIY